MVLVTMPDLGIMCVIGVCMRLGSKCGSAERAHVGVLAYRVSVRAVGVQ